MGSLACRPGLERGAWNLERLIAAALKKGAAKSIAAPKKGAGGGASGKKRSAELALA